MSIFPSKPAQYKAINPSSPFSGSNPFSKTPKEADNPKNILFPTNQNYNKFNPFNPEQKTKTPQKKGLFANIKTQPLFPATKTQNYPFFSPKIKPPQSQNPLFSFSRPQQTNPITIQNQVQDLLQLKKDYQLQRQMMEQMLKRIKELQNRNVELQGQKNQLLQRNIHLENALKAYSQPLKSSSAPNISLNFPNQPTMIQTPRLQTQLPIPITKSMPIHFDHSKSDEIFPKSAPVSIFNEDDIYPNAFTEKTFLTADGYAFQAYVAFNAFYAIKYIILQKLKNKYGYLDMTESTFQNLKSQTKGQRSKNWYLFHQNSSRNIFSQQQIDQLTTTIVNQMRQGENIPLNVSISMAKYISMTESHCTVYHPDWTIKSSFELQLYNYLNYNFSNQDTKQIIKQNVDEWIKQKTDEHKMKKSEHQLLMWFDDKSGNFHVIWHCL